MSVTRTARHLAGAARRRMFPTPVEAAWRAIEARAAEEPRRTRGRLTLLDFDLEYVDAVSLAPQWHDIFVRETLRFAPGRRNPRILDCGANVGLATLWFSRAFPEARITAFEADPAIAEVLRRNLARNGAGSVEVVEAAVWRHTGHVAFRPEGSDSGAIDLVTSATVGDVITVPSVALRDWLSEPVDFLKLDIEGAELDVLEDAAAALQQVHALQIEVHDFAPRRRLLPRCLEVLERVGFTYALSDLHPATWREEGQPDGPFENAVPTWVVLVRAWRVPE